MASKFAGSFYVSIWPRFIEWTFQQIIPFDIDTCSVVDAINVLRPSDAYKRQYTNRHSFRKWLVAWSGPCHYLNQYWIMVNWTLANIFKLNFNQNTTTFIEENACEYVVCKMAAILSRPPCVNSSVEAPSWSSLHWCFATNKTSCIHMATNNYFQILWFLIISTKFTIIDQHNSEWPIGSRGITWYLKV